MYDVDLVSIFLPNIFVDKYLKNVYRINEKKINTY